MDLSGREARITRTTEFVVADLDAVDLPVVHVTWYGADAYCRWMGGRLPTDEEFKKAALGTDGRRYPWGDERQEETSGGVFGDFGPVGRYPLGASPYGILDTYGNAREWTATLNDGREGGGEAVPGGPIANRIPRSEAEGTSGGLSFSYAPGESRTTLGFRCAKDPE